MYLYRRSFNLKSTPIRAWDSLFFARLMALHQLCIIIMIYSVLRQMYADDERNYSATMIAEINATRNISSNVF